VSLVSNAVALADSLASKFSLQSSISHEACVAVSGNGNRTFGTPVTRSAVVVKKQKLVKTASGEIVMSTAYLAFLTPVVIGLLDRITLQDGSTGPILNTEGFINVETGNPALTEVYLG